MKHFQHYAKHDCMTNPALDVALLPALFDSLTVARLRSVARAAGVLHKTPSAVSQQLRRIEQHFGVQLFERVGRGIHLSAVGEAFLGPATRLFDEAESVFGLLGSMSASPLTPLKLAVSDYLGKELLAPVLRDIHDSGAPLRFAITTAHSAESVRLLEMGAVDAAIVSGAAPRPGLDEHLLFDQPFVWVTPRRPTRAGLSSPSRSIDEALSREPVLRLSAGSLGRSLLDAYLEKQGISPISTIDVPNVSLLRAYAAAGVGVGLAPAVTLRETGSDQVAIVRADVPSVPVKLSLRANYRLSLPMATFLERVKAQGLAVAGELRDAQVPPPPRRPRRDTGAFQRSRRPR